MSYATSHPGRRHGRPPAQQAHRVLPEPARHPALHRPPPLVDRGRDRDPGRVARGADHRSRADRAAQLHRLVAALHDARLRLPVPARRSLPAVLGLAGLSGRPGDRRARAAEPPQDVLPADPRDPGPDHRGRPPLPRPRGRGDRLVRRARPRPHAEGSARHGRVDAPGRSADLRVHLAPHRQVPAVRPHGRARRDTRVPSERADGDRFSRRR